MNFAPKHLIATGLLATLGFAAMAQTAPAAPAPGSVPAAHQGRHHFDPAKMQERMAKRQAALKQKLQITSAQEASWNSFTTAMKPGARPARPDRAAIAAMSTPDRIDHMRTQRTQRIAEMDRRAEATKAFYATLNAEQQKTFDAETARRGHHGHGGHGAQGKG